MLDPDQVGARRVQGRSLKSPRPPFMAARAETPTLASGRTRAENQTVHRLYRKAS